MVLQLSIAIGVAKAKIGQRTVHIGRHMEDACHIERIYHICRELRMHSAVLCLPELGGWSDHLTKGDRGLFNLEYISCIIIGLAMQIVAAIIDVESPECKHD